MKANYLFISLIVAFTLITACIATESKNLSESNNTTPQSVTIGDLLENAPAYENRTIEVSGEITSQCGSGCWFILSGESGDLYVNLKPNNFVIPPEMGKDATVTGILMIKDSDASLIGSVVQVDGKTYP